MNQSQPKVGVILRSTCCAYNQWEDCIMGQLEHECGGPPSADPFRYLIHEGSFQSVGLLCDKTEYNYKNPDKCDKSVYEAPHWFKPKGVKSRSAISYGFSMACPNVGWGIYPERDW